MQGLLLYLGQPSIAVVTYKTFACHSCAWNTLGFSSTVQLLAHTQTHKQNKKMTSRTFQQKQNKLLICCYFPNYKLVESFDPPCEHQHKFQQHITFFSIPGIAKSLLCACNAANFIHMIQNSYQRVLPVQRGTCNSKPTFALAALFDNFIETTKDILSMA